MIVVANAGPLIALGRIDRLELLGELFEETPTPTGMDPLMIMGQ